MAITAKNEFMPSDGGSLSPDDTYQIVVTATDAHDGETKRTELPNWYESTERGGLRFLPGVLADHMAREVKAFYGAGSYFFYKRGIYEMQEDLAAQATASIL